MELAKLIYDLTDQLPSSEQFGLCSQMQRAAVSVPSNIAEGYRRNDRKEYIQFPGTALGSAAELDTQLIITSKVYTSVATATVLGLNEEIQKMLHTLITKLKS